MNTETGQSEDASTAEQQAAAASVDNNGVAQTAEGATSGGEQTQTGEAEQGGQGETQSKSQNSKQRLRRKFRESETQNAQLREDNRKLNEKFDTLSQKVDGVINPRPARPTRVDYDSDEEYEDVLHDWRNPKPAASEQQQSSEQSASTQAQKPGAEGQQQQQVSSEVQKVVDDWHDSCDDAAEKYEDFDSVTFGNKELPITTMMRDALYECNQGGEVIYHLGKNPAEAARIAGLNISGQVLAINELSKKFASTTTNAPDPIDTLKSGDAGGNSKSTDPLLAGATFE